MQTEGQCILHGRGKGAFLSMPISLARERELAFKQVREAEDVTIIKTKED